jgi:hypothetical protein
LVTNGFSIIASKVKPASQPILQESNLEEAKQSNKATKDQPHMSPISATKPNKFVELGKEIFKLLCPIPQLPRLEEPL